MATFEEIRKELTALNSQIDALNKRIDREAQRRARDAWAGTYKTQTTYCPMGDYIDCPYCDKYGICHTEDPFEDCDDWCAICGAEDWDEWESL